MSAENRTLKMQSLIQSLPHLSKNDFFNISVYQNRPDDVEYLFKNHRLEIDIFSVNNGNFLLECIKRHKNVRLLTYILMHGNGKLNSPNPKFNYINLARQFPVIIPYLIARIKNKIDPITTGKSIVSAFVDVALERNSPTAMRSLLEFKDQINDYRYTLLLCGAGDVCDLVDKMQIIHEMGDECMETAYLCRNFKIVKYLKENGIVFTNPFLEQSMREDVELVEFLTNEIIIK